MATGFAGIDNPLFVDPKTAMLFGDAKESVLKLVAGVKALVSRGVPVFGARDVEAAVPPESAVEAVRDAFVAHFRGRVDDAAEGLRDELPGGRLPRDAGARCAATRSSSG